jgi:hypothetical protein
LCLGEGVYIPNMCLWSLILCICMLFFHVWLC